MLIIMVGLPSSGKSTFVDILGSFARINKKTDLLSIIRPSDWYESIPENINQSDWHISCWEYALDRTIDLLASKSPEHIIILDSCGTSPYSLNMILASANIHHHKMIVILIATPKSVCINRTNKDVVDKYDGKVSNAILEYKKSHPKIYFVKDGTIDSWRNDALEIARKICLI